MRQICQMFMLHVHVVCTCLLLSDCHIHNRKFNLNWYTAHCAVVSAIVFEPLKSEYWLDPNLLWVVAVVSRWLFVQQTPTLLCCQTHERDRYWLSLHLHIYPLYFVCFQQSIITGWLIKISQHKQLKHWQLGSALMLAQTRGHIHWLG